MATTTKFPQQRFAARKADVIIDEICVVLSDKKTYGFNDLFEKVYENLKAKNKVTSGEEMLRLRTYEKLQNLSQRGFVIRNGKEYSGAKKIAEASSTFEKPEAV